MKNANPYDQELVQLLYEIVLFEYQNIDIWLLSNGVI